jgi:hypothetical protein
MLKIVFALLSSPPFLLLGPGRITRACVALPQRHTQGIKETEMNMDCKKLVARSVSLIGLVINRDKCSLAVDMISRLSSTAFRNLMLFLPICGLN